MESQTAVRNKVLETLFSCRDKLIYDLLTIMIIAPTACTFCVNLKLDPCKVKDPF